jgi:hypothetical protein
MAQDIKGVGAARPCAVFDYVCPPVDLSLLILLCCDDDFSVGSSLTLLALLCICAGNASYSDRANTTNERVFIDHQA